MRDRSSGGVAGVAGGGGAVGAAVDADVGGGSGRDASPGVLGVLAAVGGLVVEGVPGMGLWAGDRPADDVTGLATALCGVEAVLGMRMAAAARAGVLPAPGAGGMLLARYWSGGAARRLARAGGLALDHPRVAGLWASGVITVEHVDAVARNVVGLTAEQVAAVLDGLAPHWGWLAPARVAWFAARARRIILPPPQDPGERERSDYEARFLSFAELDGVVHLSGALPLLDGDLLRTVLAGVVDRLRAAGDGLTAGQRRADALIELVMMANRKDPTNTSADTSADAHDGTSGDASADVHDGTSDGTSSDGRADGRGPTRPGTRLGGSLDAPSGGSAVPGPDGSRSAPGPPRGGRLPGFPARGGAPIGLSVLLDPAWGLAWTSTGHLLSPAETRTITCDALVTPITISPSPSQPGGGVPPGLPGPPEWAVRLAELAQRAQGTAQPLDVGRTQRTATPAQRRALAVRDGGCVIPGCGSTSESCQPHHIIPWNAGGATDLSNLVSLCWVHHRQVELGHWTISHGRPHKPDDRNIPANNGAPFTITLPPRHGWGR